jgi:hypothetical protein
MEVVGAEAPDRALLRKITPSLVTLLAAEPEIQCVLGGALLRIAAEDLCHDVNFVYSCVDCSTCRISEAGGKMRCNLSDSPALLCCQVCSAPQHQHHRAEVPGSDGQRGQGAHS